MTLQEKLQQIDAALTPLSSHVYHYWRPKMEPPFIVWQEDGEADSFNANNHKVEQTISGTVDYFTQVEFDPVCDSIQSALNNLGAGWSLNSVQYEEDTNLIHYEWTWEVRGIWPHSSSRG